MPAAKSTHLDFERPLVTVDVVIFTLRDDQLQVLLMRRPEDAHEPFPGAWALPGGFVDVRQDSTLLDCARRKLHLKTGVVPPYLEQLGSWGGAVRDPRGWSVTNAYFALVPEGAFRPGGLPGAEHNAVCWAPADEAAGMHLAFDHREILAAAISRLRGKVEYTSLPAFLLPEPITLPQLQHVYEVVLCRELDKSAFRRRMLDAGFLEEVGSIHVGSSARRAQAFRIRDRTAPAVFPRTFRTAEN